MTNRKRPLLGLLAVLGSATLFWGSALGIVVYSYERRQETKTIELACEKMIDYGWAITQSDCVRELRP